MLRTTLIVLAVALAVYVAYLLRKPISWLVIAAFIAVAVAAPVRILSRHMPKRDFPDRHRLHHADRGADRPRRALDTAARRPGRGPREATFRGTCRTSRTSPSSENETLQEPQRRPRHRPRSSGGSGKLPGKIGDAANILGDIGVGIVNSIFALVTIASPLDLPWSRAGSAISTSSSNRKDDRHRERLRRAFDSIANAISSYVGGALIQATLARTFAFIDADDPRRAVRGCACAGRCLRRPDSGGQCHGRRVLRRDHDAVRQLPGRPDRVDRLRDLPAADRELRDPAADPAAGRPETSRS